MHDQKSAAERAQAIERSSGGAYSQDQWKSEPMPLKGKPPLVDGRPEDKKGA